MKNENILNIDQHTFIKEIEIYKVDDELNILLYKNTSFEVSQVLYQIIKFLKEGMSIKSIYEKFSFKDVNLDSFKTLIVNKIEELIKEVSGTVDRVQVDSIHKLFNILNDKTTDILSGKLSFLFRKGVLISLCVLFLCSLIFILSGRLAIHKPSIGINHIWILYLCFFIIGIFHELGHSSASKYYGAKPSEISLGIFLIFPVFYTDVTKTWGLNRMKRIVTSLGGIYFQMIIHLVLFGMLFLEIEISLKGYIYYIILQNIGLMIFNLNPFFKTDGYWVVSDIFGIRNLNTKSKELIKFFLKSKYHPDYPFKENKALYIYTYLYSIIGTALLFFITYKVFDTLHMYYSIIIEGVRMEFLTVFKRSLILFFLVVFHFIPFLKKKIKKQAI
ncbi:M50 family metallopeptidase [Chryseobacterium sp. CFBP8996]|uniref:M50 family metallopeptidase n=1 Tax=Chryseobacterium sp. CFBP8996 TaxID=3096529 RepID=UPI002A69D946|nr:M50 family metallopeptidase [Chryseobacterium sp. CFBP8996]MDY0930806.1 M50 family metallopeptidase [Chryseobacterium sp. CFBP8996]